MSDPWAFGWTQLLTIVGLFLTTGIAAFGFRSFDRWKREQIEERKIEIALKALEIAYHSKWVFDNIRSPLVYSYEWEDMPQGGPEERRSARGEFYARLKRIQANKEFFQSVWETQPKCMAVFGTEVEEVFLELHKARRKIEVAAEMLTRHMDDPQLPGDNRNRELWAQLRADLCGDEGALAPDGDRVGRKLLEFRTRIEALCRPVIDRELGQERNGVFRRIKRSIKGFDKNEDKDEPERILREIQGYVGYVRRELKKIESAKKRKTPT